MALQGFIGSNSYTVVCVGAFDKHEKNVSIIVKTYEDSTKSRLVSVYAISTNAPNAQNVKSMSVSSPPEFPDVGDRYIVGPYATDDWAGKENRVVEWNGDIWFYHDIESAYVEDEDKTYKLSGSSWSEDIDRIDRRTFDNNFSISHIGGDGKDILKSFYVYIKSRPEFSGCSDV